MTALPLDRLQEHIIACRECPRLVRLACSRSPPSGGPRFETRSIGPARPELWRPGRPSAHHRPGPGGATGGNRTGRVFTGDRSGDFLFAALHRWPASPTSRTPARRRLSQAHRLAFYIFPRGVPLCPPDNTPTPTEREVLPRLLGRGCCACWKKVRCDSLLLFGGFAWDGVLAGLREGFMSRIASPAFGHGAEAAIGPYRLIGCYHPSQQEHLYRPADAGNA